MLRLVDQGRVAVSATTRRASAAAIRRIADVLTGGDFFDPAEKKKDRWSQVAGPIRSFAWPLLLQAARLAQPHGSKLALTRAGRAALGEPPANTLQSLWQRWMSSSLLDEFNRIDAIKGQYQGKGKTQHDEAVRTAGPPSRMRWRNARWAAGCGTTISRNSCSWRLSISKSHATHGACTSAKAAMAALAMRAITTGKSCRAAM